eukprot:TRINITY_DN3872_c0_g2_i2.p1 TRINITY_DN3872_c0_g2~~TRINITY_DN3872_c0_g2_i2.p1  ORF type:complete len:931 (-),score=218.55 TRINITY_DN3872_c0_g2_i2:13-2805(-)
MVQAFELVVKDSSEPVDLVSLSVTVVTCGFLAETRVTAEFRNSTDTDLEGELVFPLDEGSTVCGYAVDIKGVMVEAAVCEKETARKAFETEVREKRAGPAMIESVVGNTFKTRIYPLPRHGTRTVCITFSSELTDTSRSRELKYFFPLLLKKAVPLISLHIESDVPAGAAKPLFVDTDELSGVEFRAQTTDERFVADVVFADSRVTKGVAFTIGRCPRRQVVVEKDVSGENAFFFSISDSVTIQSAPAHPQTERIGVLWDCSRSRDQADLSKEFAMLNAVVQNLKNVTVDVYQFRNVPSDPETFKITNGRWQPLESHLRSAIYDGGTSIGAVRAPQLGPNGVQVSYYLMFTDGLNTLGRELPTVLEAPVYVFCSALIANHVLLKSLARKSGGQFFNLAQDHNASSLAASLGKQSFGFLSASIDKVESAELYPSSPTPISGSTFKLAGRLTLAEGQTSVTVRLSYGFGALVRDVVQVDLSFHQNGESTGRKLVGRWWASKKIEELLLEGADEPHVKPQLLATGKQFGLVTPSTSLIVLETLEQYLRHEIEPPKVLGDLWTEWTLAMQQRKREKEERLEAKLQYVVDLWERRKHWWNTHHSDLEWAPEFVHHMSHQHMAQIDAADFRNPVSWKEMKDNKLREEERQRLKKIEEAELERKRLLSVKADCRRAELEKRQQRIERQRAQLEHDERLARERLRLEQLADAQATRDEQRAVVLSLELEKFVEDEVARRVFEEELRLEEEQRLTEESERIVDEDRRRKDRGVEATITVDSATKLSYVFRFGQRSARFRGKQTVDDLCRTVTAAMSELDHTEAYGLFSTSRSAWLEPGDELASASLRAQDVLEVRRRPAHLHTSTGGHVAAARTSQLAVSQGSWDEIDTPKRALEAGTAAGLCVRFPHGPSHATQTHCTGTYTLLRVLALLRFDACNNA